MTFKKKFFDKSPLKMHGGPHGLGSGGYNNLSMSDIMTGPTPPMPLSQMSEIERERWLSNTSRWRHDQMRKRRMNRRDELDEMAQKAAEEELEDENGEEKLPWWKRLFKKKEKSAFKNKAEREMYAEQKKTGKLPRKYRGL
tara:strand:+ start:921 stop:1343 length:423 start_codon:yes stop_codon:yes gene_type:complete